MTHSFPTRRSSDLLGGIGNGFGEFGLTARASVVGRGSEALGGIGRRRDGHGGNCQAAPVVRPRWRRICVLPVRQCRRWQRAVLELAVRGVAPLLRLDRDRKSTRLKSSK